MDLSLFPNKEEWGTGDEAMDNRLSIALKKTIFQLSLESIGEFYFLAISLKPRVFNPSFLVTVELVTKALFHFFNPKESIEDNFKKMEGHYSSKIKIPFTLVDKDLIVKELKQNKKYRYKNQIDFSLNLQSQMRRSPYVKEELKGSSIDLALKIIFKEFKFFLNEDVLNNSLNDPLFLGLKGGKNILLIADFAEIWFHEDRLYGLSCLSIG